MNHSRTIPELSCNPLLLNISTTEQKSLDDFPPSAESSQGNKY